LHHGCWGWTPLWKDNVRIPSPHLSITERTTDMRESRLTRNGTKSVPWTSQRLLYNSGSLQLHGRSSSWRRRLKSCIGVHRTALSVNGGGRERLSAVVFKAVVGLLLAESILVGEQAAAAAVQNAALGSARLCYYCSSAKRRRRASGIACRPSVRPLNGLTRMHIARLFPAKYGRHGDLTWPRGKMLVGVLR